MKSREFLSKRSNYKRVIASIKSTKVPGKSLLSGGYDHGEGIRQGYSEYPPEH